VARKRHFGNVRKRESGRWQVRYRGPDGRVRSAPQTFGRRAEAERYLALLEAQIARGEWTDPALGKVTVKDYAERWIAERPGLRPRTAEQYRYMLRRHIVPWLGTVPVGKVDTPLVREWRAKLLAEGVSQTMAAKSYRLLRAVMMTAVNEDRIILYNPCRVRGADKEHPKERPVLTVGQVVALADAVPPRYRAMILLTTFASLRFGEVTALERDDIDLDGGTVRVRRAYVEQVGRGLTIGPPKSRAGVRVVSVPPTVVAAVRDHLADFPSSNGLVFTVPSGTPVRRGNLNQLLRWRQALDRLGLADVRFHDLRHTGNTLAAASGVSTRDLMSRMGHDSMQAAIGYQHATAAADARITAALEGALSSGVDQVDDGRQGDEDDDGGASGVLAPA
jgi:integrase